MSAPVDHIHESLRPLAVPIGSLNLDGANVRKHNQRNMDSIKASLAHWGQRAPVIVQRQGMIVRAGNGRVIAARELGWPTMAALIVDENDVEATAFAIADNRTAELAEWDDEALAAMLAGLQNDGSIDHLLTGFDDAEIEALVDGVAGGSEATEDDGAGEVPVEPITQPGDLYALGAHRLLCGDSTNPEHVARLLGGGQPFIMVTDPPYGVEYDPDWRNRAERANGEPVAASRSTGKVQNDDRVDWTDAYKLFAGAVAYVWHAGKFAAEVAVTLGAADFEVRAQIIWRKPRFAISRGHYHWQHEPCWYAVRKGQSAKWCGDRSQSTMWEIAQKDSTGETNHGTQKPVECMARPIRNHGGKGDDVYDPFLGSGTTLIACEQLGRKCFGMEIDPGYCDVIVARWEKLTGRKAERHPA